MNKLRNILFYILLFGGGSAFIWFVVQLGDGLEIADELVRPSAYTGQWGVFVDNLLENFSSPFAILLVQIIIVLFVARILGFLFKKIGQPGVIGEILAGIVLGPSLIGAYFPEFFNFLFPAHSLDNLSTISNIGLILFMFVVGMELDMRVLREKIGESVAISQAGIIFPFALGMGLAYFLYERFVPPSVPFLSFALFVGVSMSITAFPVLARIAQERGLSKSKLGTVILACAAINDIMAWCILAVIIAIAKAGTVASSLYTIAFAATYVVVMLKVAKPFLKKISEFYSSRENLNKSVVAVYFLVLLLSAFCTELIGIHALFGAFMAGAIMPDNKQFRDIFVEKIEDVATIIFLPLFFVYTGLRTKLGLLNEVSLWETAGLITLVAIVGKLVGSAVAAKYVGRHSWRNSLVVGTLMNTRGLMELVAINIGYDLGVISSEIFVMLVLMALVTTFMTSPMLSLIEKIFPDKEKDRELARKQIQGIFKVLVAVGNPQNGKFLLRVAKRVLDGVKNTLEVTALHITAGSDTNPLHGEEFMRKSFEGIENEANMLNVPLLEEYALSDKVEEKVIYELNSKQFDFLLIGAGLQYAEKPFVPESSLFGKIKWLNKLTQQHVGFYPQVLIKDKTRYLVENAHCTVGIFVNRNFHQITSTLIVLSVETDGFFMRYARRLLRNTSAEAQITIIDTNNILVKDTLAAETFENLRKTYPNNIKLSRIKNISNISNHYSLMMISYDAWKTLVDTNKWELRNIPSTLIISKKASRFGK
ncbi:MAG: cation:proton antiporter [Prevotellaceae bacterium]|jgi:Kef-type K+ transport system membrane component KefB|nr:cation:proton antiporter [Prevotellaceae bacterium]